MYPVDVVDDDASTVVLRRTERTVSSLYWTNDVHGSGTVSCITLIIIIIIIVYLLSVFTMFHHELAPVFF